MLRLLLVSAALTCAACAGHPLSRASPFASRNAAAYTEREAFLVSDRDWRTVVQLVPVATWTQQPAFAPAKLFASVHPALVYHLEPSGAFDADAVIHFLQQYRPTRVTFVGRPPAELYALVASGPVQNLGAGLDPAQVRIIDASGLYSFWSSADTVLYVEDDYGLASLAATYASLLDMPIIVGKFPLAWPGAWKPKTVICVGQVLLPKACSKRLNARQLALSYVKLARATDVVVMNPKDLTMGSSSAFQPERSSAAIATTFSSLSLAAPFLASARHALLVPVALDPNDCGPHEGTSHAQFDTAQSMIAEWLDVTHAGDAHGALTIVASPRAVPYWSDCGNAYSGAADWQYGARDGAPHVIVGRIYGVTASDVSAYVARAIFYHPLSAALYARSHAGLAIAAPGFETDQTEAQEIAQHLAAGGYAMRCYTAVGPAAQPSCGTYTALVAADYQGRELITFADHGSPTSWASTLTSHDIPWLDFPAAFSLACLTNDFWAGAHDTFGPNWIRRGGISYFASIPSTDGISWELWWTQELTGDSRLTSGELAKRLIQRTDSDSEVRRQYMLLGDPTLRPRSMKVTW